MHRRRIAGLVLGLASACALIVTSVWDDLWEKRVAVVTPGQIVRGAWQRPGPLRELIRREHVKTVVTLTAINRDDPKYGAQERVVRATGVDWVFVPMRGSTATLEQMGAAADFLADPARRPVFFHCVAGHHRSSLAQAAYRVRHQGWSAERAWREVAALPWARPDARADRDDRRRIEEFAALEADSRPRSRKDLADARDPVAEMAVGNDRGRAAPGRGLLRREPGD